MQQIRATDSASISELKKNPSALLVKADGKAIAILNHNSPTAYLMPALEGEMLLDYKVKLRSAGYRLVYEVDDDEIIVFIIAVGKRENSAVYSDAEARKSR